MVGSWATSGASEDMVLLSIVSAASIGPACALSLSSYCDWSARVGADGASEDLAPPTGLRRPRRGPTFCQQSNVQLSAFSGAFCQHSSPCSSALSTSRSSGG